MTDPVVDEQTMKGKACRRFPRKQGELVPSHLWVILVQDRLDFILLFPSPYHAEKIHHGAGVLRELYRRR